MPFFESIPKGIFTTENEKCNRITVINAVFCVYSMVLQICLFLLSQGFREKHSETLRVMTFSKAFLAMGRKKLWTWWFAMKHFHFLLYPVKHSFTYRSISIYRANICPKPIRVRSLVVSDLRSETKGSRFESGCYLCAEVSCLQ